MKIRFGLVTKKKSVLTENCFYETVESNFVLMPAEKHGLKLAHSP